MCNIVIAKTIINTLYFDVAKCHMGPDVIDFAWKRGYVCQLIYGGCTGLLQVNDTDCHGLFEGVYLDFETQAFHDKQTVDPSDIGRVLVGHASGSCLAVVGQLMGSCRAVVRQA